MSNVTEGFEDSTLEGDWSYKLDEWGRTKQRASSGSWSYASPSSTSHSTHYSEELQIHESGTLSFDWFVASEGGYDYFKVYKNGTQILSKSGVVGWNTHSESVTKDDVIKFNYEKDGSVSESDDRAYIDNVSIPASDPPDGAPSSVSLTVNSNDSIDVSVTDGSTNEDNFRVQISRDGSNYQSPSGGPTTFSTSSQGSTGTTYTKNYNPNSDNAYQSQVGIDSSFKFRARAENTDGNSSWTYSGTGYTDPIPPHSPYVSNRNGTQLNINWTNQTNIYDHVECQYRKDSGSGYGAWTSAFTDADTAHHIDNDKYTWFDKDSRYQFRLRTVAPDGKTSKWVYSDYGNNGNVYFQDDFEDQDFAEWTATSGATIETGSPSGNDADTGISGSDQGTYHAAFDAAGYIRKNLGDLSGENDVIVKAAVAVGSQDTNGEFLDIRWYDGSSWHDVRTIGWEYNRQGWVEVTILIPNSYLSTDNRVQFGGDSGGGGDQHAVDRVVVSDLLHEYTTPTAPSNPSLDNTTEDQITASWTNNHAFADDVEAYFGKTGTTIGGQNLSIKTSHTYTGLGDGESYDFYVQVAKHQYRNGSRNNEWDSASSATVSAVTKAPRPGSFSIDNIQGAGASGSWTESHDNEDAWRGYIRKNTSETGMDFTSGDYIDFGDDKSLYGMSAITVHFRGTITKSNEAVMFSKEDPNASTDDYGIRMEGTGDIRFYIRTDDNVFDSIMVAQPSQNEIHDFTLTWSSSSGTLRAYINGSEVGSLAKSGNYITTQSRATLRMGVRDESSGTNPYEGTAYTGIVYARELSASEVSDLANGKIVTGSRRLYAPLDHDDAGTTYDESQYFNNGTVSGTTLVGPTVTDDSGALAANTTSYSFTPPSNNQYEVFVASETEHGRTRSDTSIVKIATGVPRSTSTGVWKTESNGVVDTSWYTN